MGKYKCVIFDLDGTIANTKPGIINGFKYALGKMGTQYLNAHDDDIIGPSLYDSFSRFYHFSDEKSIEAVKIYRQYYKEKGMYEYELYDGIEELLAKLQANAVTLALATTKYKAFAEQMLAHSNLISYFNCVIGSNEDGSFSSKKELLGYVREFTNHKANECVMIGDRYYDAYGAQLQNMDFVWVKYGYGKEKEFEEIRVKYMASDAREIFDIIMNNENS
jgi:phosphoglycolate phosphatase